jgi:hypothetical protein
MKTLVGIAKDLNEVMGLDPKIPVVGITKEKLTAQIKKASAMIDPINDEFTPETVAGLKNLGFWKEDDSDQEDTPEALDLESLIHQTKDLKELKALVKDREEFKPLRKRIAGMFDLNDLREEMLSLLDPDYTPPAPEKKPKAEKAPEKKGPNQTTLIRSLIKSKAKRETIVKELAETFEKTEGWANSRLKVYENAYGEMGVNDKNL